ncbi:MAG: tripartite tricarboxylate transporter substrate binding protein [Polaromonas sp.]|jgi:tripartite-type tricarboxylate transporter receptor subunit TctC|nr:tripartite tricarboxylate transporter substrate binding protein [Polaromonas sp.]
MTKILRQWLSVLPVSLCLIAINPMAAWAQAYPNKPVKVIVTFPPGGTPDIYGRILSQELSNLWKQSVVVENKTGASGTIGTDFVVKSAPDGYTLLFAADASITIAPNLLSNVPYNAAKDLTPIINAASGPFVLMANPNFPANDLKSLIALAKQRPGEITYASSGAGGQQHLAMEMVKHMADVKITHVPYKGFGQGVNDVMAGHVPLIFGGITASIQLSKSGKLKALAVTSAKRSKAMPQVPAIAETLPGFRIEAWYGFMGPAGMPKEVVKKIHDDVASIIKRPDFQARIAADAMEPVADSSEEFAMRISEDLNEWAKLIKSAQIKLD